MNASSICLFNMLQGYKGLSLAARSPAVYLRCMSTVPKSESRKHRNELFEKEKKRQRSQIGRIEKIKVIYHGPEDEITFLMNKNLSTPHECARHISEGVATLSALATVDGIPWDMHKPFTSDCRLELFTMRTPGHKAVNNAFWRTCALVLGAVVDSAFKDDIPCHLHSFPSPNIKSGSFVYDVHLELPDWKPTMSEMRALSGQFSKFIFQELPLERLEVDENLALDMFQENPYKSSQIPDIVRNSDNKVTLYRVGEHVDISKGPMVANTNIIGRCTLTGIHKIQSDHGESLHRFQGIALPKGLIVNHFVYSILEKRAEKLNETIWMPQRLESQSDTIVAAATN